MNKRKNEGHFFGWNNPAKRMKFGNQQHHNPYFLQSQQPQHQNSRNLPKKKAVMPFKHKKIVNNSPSHFEAVLALRKLRETVSFNFEGTVSDQNGKFAIVSVVIDGKKYHGKAKNISLAKNVAAQCVLRDLQGQQNADPNTDEFDNIRLKTLHISQSFVDKIGSLILVKFNELISKKDIFAANRARRVLAGIVITHNLDIASAKVIACSTGSRQPKCVNGDYMSCNGCVINDTHAEIIARRCLVDFFYSQLESLVFHNQRSIFYEPEPESVPKKFRLRESFDVHLFISAAPCGDARIFSPRETVLNNDMFPNRTNRGLLRKKVEGAGTIPVRNNDGVAQEQQLLTMSCSDKIAKWNLLGLQGTLLSSLIEPVYLSSITVGSLLHPEHMHRAVCGRIKLGLDRNKLPPKYRLNEPLLAQLTKTVPREPVVTPPYSINWTNKCKEVEVVHSQTGKTAHGQVSRLTKQSFFKRYTTIAEKCGLKYCHDNKYYSEVKNSIKDYQCAKTAMYESFNKQGFGIWLKKPLNQDKFTLFTDNTIIGSALVSGATAAVASVPEIFVSPILTNPIKDSESDDVIIVEKSAIVIDLTDSDDEDSRIPTSIASMQTDVKFENLNQSETQISKNIDETDKAPENQSIVTFIEPMKISNRLPATLTNDNVSKSVESEIANSTQTDLPAISDLVSAIINDRANSLSCMETEKNFSESSEMIKNETEDKIAANAKAVEEKIIQAESEHDNDVEALPKNELSN